MQDICSLCRDGGRCLLEGRSILCLFVGVQANSVVILDGMVDLVREEGEGGEQKVKLELLRIL